VAVCDALALETHLPVEIKWPNDILIHGNKVCGILTEAHWDQNRCVGVIMGIGVNVGKTSIPPSTDLLYSASSIETEFGKPINRKAILEQILRSLIEWRQSPGSHKMLEYWRNHLAYLHQDVRVEAEGRPNLIGSLDGIGDSGDLRIITKDGKTISVDMGDVHLRLLDQPV
jgi:BirA family biotin operon repressor/biotin-[acetyl-CoA-carboxylase] ligase